MFTGIVEEIGAITSMEKTLTGTRMTILASTVLGDLKLGDSVSVNGTCLTVVSRNEQGFSVDVSPETLSVTTLSLLAPGSPVNLERAMKLSERIGGHRGRPCGRGRNNPGPSSRKQRNRVHH